MRIAHLSTMTGYYGGEVCLANLAVGMRDRGHEVSCVVRPGSRLQAVLERAGVPVFPLPLLDWYEPVTMSRLGRWLRQRRIQILHSHLPRDYFIAAGATLGTGVRNVGSRHQLLPISHAALKRPFLRRFQAVIAVSDAVRRGVLASELIEAERVVTIHNGIAARPAPAAGDAGALRRAAGAAADAPVVGFVGRLCPSKGIETLLAAAARVRRDVPDLRVFLLGDDPAGDRYPRSLRRLAAQLGLADAVSFFGYVPDADRACREFDVQVVCSQAEPFGLVTVEAMAQGRPVVVTASGGSPEIVRDGVEGFLFRPGDAAALARRLDCLLDSPGLRREMGRRGRRRVARLFTSERMLERTEELYRQVLESPEAPPALPAS